MILLCLTLANAHHTHGPHHTTNTITRTPDVYENKLRPEFGVNFKFNGILYHNLDRVWVVTKVPIPRADILILNMDAINTDTSFHCNKYMEQVREKCQNCMRAAELVVSECEHARAEWQRIGTHHKALRNEFERLDNELASALPELYSGESDQSGPDSSRNQSQPLGRSKRSIGAIIGGLFTIASETVSFILQKKRQQAIQKANKEMIEKVAKFSKNKIRQLEDSQVMYGEYSLDGLEAVKDTMVEQSRALHKVINDIENGHKFRQWETALQTRQPLTEDIPMIIARTWYRQKYRSLIQIARDQNLYSMNILVKEFEKMLKGISTLSRGRIPQEIIDHTEIKDMVNTVETMLMKKFPSYRVAMETTNQYYDMKLATVMVDPKERSLVITFPIFIRPYSLPPMSLYEIETVPVPIDDLNTELDSYTEARIEKPYIAANDQYYIQLRIPELRMCKFIDHKYFCEEIFLMKHKTKHSCESALLYELSPHQIKHNCDFDFHINTTVTPAVLDGGDTLVLANFGSRKKLNCEHHHRLDVPMTMTTHQYQIVDRSILCACRIEADLIAVLRSVSACKAEVRKIPPLYFTSNSAFNLFAKEFIDKATETGTIDIATVFENATQELISKVHTTSTRHEITYPFKLKDVRNPENNQKPDSMKRLIETIDKIKAKQIKDKETQDEETDDLNYPEHLTMLQSSPVLIFEFMTSCITSIATGYIIYRWCKTNKPLAPLIAVVGTAGKASGTTITTTSPQSIKEMVACPISTLSYIILAVTIVSIIVWMTKIMKRMTWLKGDILCDTCTIELWIWHGIRYVPIAVHQLPGHCTLFQRMGYLQGVDLRLHKKRLWDTLEIDWQQCQIYYKTEHLELPTHVEIALRDKLRVRKIMSEENYFRTQLMIRTGKNLFQVPNCIGPRPGPRMTEEMLDRMIDEEEQIDRTATMKPNKPARRQLRFESDTPSPHTSTTYTSNTTTPSIPSTNSPA